MDDALLNQTKPDQKAGRYVFEVYAKGTGSPRDAKQKDLQRQQRLRCGNKAPASRQRHYILGTTRPRL